MAKKTTLVVERELHSAKDAKPEPNTSVGETLAIVMCILCAFALIVGLIASCVPR